MSDFRDDPGPSTTSAGQRPTADTTPDEPRDPLRRSRTSSVWIAVLLLAVVLVVLIVFIAQNTQDVEISFFGWSGQSPLAVALLIATVAGMVVVAIAATLRMWQVRRRVRRDRR